jgi:hypothetical protein
VLLAEPVHNGKRWAIVAQVVEPGSPLTLRVSLLPVKPAK